VPGAADADDWLPAEPLDCPAEEPLGTLEWLDPDGAEEVLDSLEPEELDGSRQSL